MDHSRRPQPANGLTDRATTITFLLRDPDSRFTTAFDAVFAADGIPILTSPPRAPRANTICEQMIATLRRELLDRILSVNERHLRRILAVYLQHFNTAPHRALTQAAPLRPLPPPTSPPTLRLRRRDRLSGLIHEYAQVA